jgi:hypothetical protein
MELRLTPNPNISVTIKTPLCELQANVQNEFRGVNHALSNRIFFYGKQVFCNSNEKRIV